MVIACCQVQIPKTALYRSRKVQSKVNEQVVQSQRERNVFCCSGCLDAAVRLPAFVEKGFAPVIVVPVSSSHLLTNWRRRSFAFDVVVQCRNVCCTVSFSVANTDKQVAAGSSTDCEKTRMVHGLFWGFSGVIPHFETTEHTAFGAESTTMTHAAE